MWRGAGFRYTGLLDEHLQTSVLNRMPAGFTTLVQQKEPEDELNAEPAERVFDMSASQALSSRDNVGETNSSQNNLRCRRSILKIVAS